MNDDNVTPIKPSKSEVFVDHFITGITFLLASALLGLFAGTAARLTLAGWRIAQIAWGWLP